jgi:chromosome segregation ATPase
VDATALAAVAAACGTLASGAGAGYAGMRARSAERAQGVHETLKLSLDARAEDIIRLRSEINETRDEVRLLRQDVRDCHRDRAALADANEMLQDTVARLERTVGNGT